MHLEYPVREEHARLFLNRPVGVVLTDGTRHYGVLTGCEKGKLVLNGFAETAKPKRKRTGKRKRASSSAAPFAPAIPYDPYNPYTPVVPPGPRVALDLATIALLFALLP
jgi:small nuclear ribonucleoprotein (snRNP)-like protein